MGLCPFSNKNTTWVNWSPVWNLPIKGYKNYYCITVYPLYAIINFLIRFFNSIFLLLHLFPSTSKPPPPDTISNTCSTYESQYTKSGCQGFSVAKLNFLLGPHSVDGRKLISFNLAAPVPHCCVKCMGHLHTVIWSVEDLVCSNQIASEMWEWCAPINSSYMWSSMLIPQTETLETISQRCQGDKKVRALNPELSPTVEPPAN